MTNILTQVEQEFDEGKLDHEYGEYLTGRLPIGNGDQLIRAMENQELVDDFLDHLVAKREDEEAKYLLDNPPLCGACNGSGEGMYDGTTCTRCRGVGTVQQGEV